MEDSPKHSFQEQDGRESKASAEWCYEQLGDLEAELEALPEPQAEDYKDAKKYQTARVIYRVEIHRVWERIHRLMRRWPPPV